MALNTRLEWAVFFARKRFVVMRKSTNHTDILTELLSFEGMTVIDVGCGNGDFVRWLAGRGAEATGVDTVEMISRAMKNKPSGNERYLAGSAEDLPFENARADIIMYMASFHHVPADRMPEAIDRCRRNLKTGGKAVFIEPVGRKGSYYEVVRLVEEEKAMHAAARKAIYGAVESGFRSEAEETYYIERSFSDYENLVAFFVDDSARRKEAISAARAVTERLAAEAGVDFDDFRFKSICRLNILERIK